MSQESASVPRLSVVVCHRAGRDCLGDAVASVLAQDGPTLEVLLVLDACADEPDLPRDERVRIVRSSGTGVGAARDTALRAARAELIGYCDDDDRWLPGHGSNLVRYLDEHPDVDLVYADSIWVENGIEREVEWSIDFDRSLLGYGNYIHASDTVHRKPAALLVGGFDTSLTAHEDWDLWLRMSMGSTCRHVHDVLGTHGWRLDCVTAADHSHEWSVVFDRHTDRLERADEATRHDLVLSPRLRADFDPTTWRADSKQLLWHSLLRVNEGYGSAGRHLLRGLVDAGVDVRLAPSVNQVSAEHQVCDRPPSAGTLAFYYDWRVRPSVLGPAPVISCSMWESTRLPPDHVAEINAASVLHFVPCQQNVESFAANGVTVPIRVLRHGVDGQRFPPLERPARDEFVIGTFGDLSPRKGIDVLISAFAAEFQPSEPVRLLLKSSSPIELPIDDPRITVSSGHLDQAALLELLRAMDVFALPSRGEGFGLCGLEAMATGLPLIATNWSGPADYLDDEDCLPLTYRLVDANGIASNHVTYHGLWAEPDGDHLRYLMRYAFEHPEEMRRRGGHAAERVARDWTWNGVASQLVADFDEVVTWL